MGSDVYGLPSRETYPDSQNKCSDAAKIRIISLPSKQISIILSFFSKSSFVSKIFRQALCQNRSRQQHRVKLSALESEGNQAARSNCSSSHRCHRSAHRGSTWFLLSRCKYTNFEWKFQILHAFWGFFEENSTAFVKIWLKKIQH